MFTDKIGWFILLLLEAVLGSASLDNTNSKHESGVYVITNGYSLSRQIKIWKVKWLGEKKYTDKNVSFPLYFIFTPFNWEK